MHVCRLYKCLPAQALAFSYMMNINFRFRHMQKHREHRIKLMVAYIYIFIRLDIHIYIDQHARTCQAVCLYTCIWRQVSTSEQSLPLRPYSSRVQFGERALENQVLETTALLNLLHLVQKVRALQT